MQTSFKFQNLFLLFSILLSSFCKQESLNNYCDPKSDSYLSSLFFQSATTAASHYCGNNLVNVPPFEYKFSNYRLYLNFPVSIIPRYKTNSSYSVLGALPVGLSFDSFSGEIKGTTAAITENTPITITRSNPGYAVFTITLQVVDTSATMVYGQYGSFTCGITYNTGACAISAVASSQNLSAPYWVTVDTSGGVYISGVNRIQYYPPNINASSRVYGQFGDSTCDVINRASAGTCAGTAVSENSLNSVRGIGIDQDNGLYAADMGNNRILHFSNNSSIPFAVYGQPGFTSFSAGPASATTLSTPMGVTHASDGGVYTSESAYHRVLYFPAGSTTASRVYGQPDLTSSSSGCSNIKMSSPNGMVLDSEGGLYISDNGNSRILYFPPGSTTATRVYGQPDFITCGGGSSGPTSLSGPTGLALDQSDNLFVADSGNNRVVMYPRTTQTEGIAAVAVFGQFNDLICSVANNGGSCNAGVIGPKSLYSPTGIFFNKFGQLYIADRMNHRVLVY
ncbi:hypothetical protein EHQ47_17945 [Leptospira bourretii]|uniref:NHL repeat-containing protein n=1 Tax=Leptospira bourretii TaxID=2484962 RepID=UPI0010912F2B|nr:NHL repeat-containing protein [Leptospira bourretii]TGL18412.1 hypothetical protein EHQ47_17945 [Leptospira bourretii]